MERCNVLVENQSFSDKININKVPVPLTSQRYKRNVGERTELFHKPSSHIAYLFKQSTEYISKRASQLAGETCFLNSEMPKKFHPCPRINKSTEQHPRVTYYSPIFFPTTANHCSLQYYWSQQVGPREIRRKLYIYVSYLKWQFKRTLLRAFISSMIFMFYFTHNHSFKPHDLTPSLS